MNWVLKDAVVVFLLLSVNGSLISVIYYFVLEYVTPIFVSCGSCDVPMLVEYAPSSFTPAKVRKVELNGIVP